MYPLILFGLFAPPVDSPAPDLPGVEAKALDARRKIESISLTATGRLFHKSGGPPGDTTYVWKLWADGSKLRGDRTYSSGPYPGVRVVHVIGCERNDWSLEYVEKRNLGAFFRPTQQTTRDSLYAAIDPRNIGYLVGELLLGRHSSYDAFALALTKSRDQAQMAVVNKDGRKVYEISWSSEDGKTVTKYHVTIAPDYGYNVEAIQIRGGEGKAEWVYSTVSTGFQKHDSGLWFPTKVVSDSTSGGRVTMREEVDLSDISINEKIPASVFTRQGVGIQEGTHLTLPRGQQSGFWKDGRIQPPSNPGPHPKDGREPVPVSVSSGIRWPYAALAGGTSLAAVGVLVRRRSKVRMT